MHPRADRVPQDGTTRRPWMPPTSICRGGWTRASSIQVAPRACAPRLPLVDALFAEALGELGRARHRVRRRDRRRARALGRLRRARPRVGIRARCRHGLPHLLDDEELHRDGRALAARRGQARHRRTRSPRSRPTSGALAEAGPDAPPVTVRQLLTMDAGLPQDDPWADRLMADDNAWVSAEVFARGATRSRAPGTAFEYSNYGWAALGRVIEVVTGQRHQDVVRERVLEPLGLRSTVWSAGDLPPEQVATRLPRGRRRLHGRGAAGGRRLLLGARRPLQQRARPGALERGVPRRRTAARRARDGAREPRDAARDVARPQRVPARRRMAVAGRAARRGRRRLRLRPHDLARARRRSGTSGTRADCPDSAR